MDTRYVESQEVRGISQSHRHVQRRTFEDAISRTMPPPNFVPDRHHGQQASRYPRSDVGGGRFNGPERSPSLKDISIARGAHEGYTASHDKYKDERHRLASLARENHSNRSTVYNAKVKVRSNERGSSKMIDFGMVSRVYDLH